MEIKNQTLITSAFMPQIKPKSDEIREKPAEDRVELCSSGTDDNSKINDPKTITTAGNAVNLQFLHVNDLHGYVEEAEKPDKFGTVGGITKLAGEINEQRAENPEGTVLLEGGDFFDGGFYSKFTKGEIVSKPYENMGFDAAVLGNHDVSWGLEAYADLAKDAGLTVLGANVKDLSKEKHLDLKPYKVVERNGVRIGILGLTTSLTSLTANKSDKLEIADPAETAKKYIKTLKQDEKADMVVVLSHLGYQEDVKLANGTEGIDIIIGSHSHTKMDKPEKVGNTLVVQAGNSGKYVGDLEVAFDKSSKKIVSYEGSLVPITQETKTDPEVAQIIAPYLEKYSPVKNKVIGETQGELNKFKNLNNLFVDILKLDADVAMNSRASIRGGFQKGPIKFGDLFQMYPFDNELVQVKAKGENVLSYLESGLKGINEGKDSHVLISGVTYEYNPKLIEGHRVTSVTMKGKKYSRDEFAKEEFKLNIDNYAHGKGYFKNCPKIKEYGKVFELLQDYMVKNSPIPVIAEEARSKATNDVPDPALLMKS